jgi:hypothetical protein
MSPLNLENEFAYVLAVWLSLIASFVMSESCIAYRYGWHRSLASVVPFIASYRRPTTPLRDTASAVRMANAKK